MTGDVKLPSINLELNKPSSFKQAMELEWLLTNGLGGYASSTVLGVNTRKYHGLLVAAMNPPVERHVLLAKLDEDIKVENEIYRIGTNEFQHGFFPEGYNFLKDFSLNPFPTYKYEANKVFELEKKIFMPHEKNATIILYDVANLCENKISIPLWPLINFRHFYSVTERKNFHENINQKMFDNGVLIEAATSGIVLLLASNLAKYVAGEGRWVEKMYFRMDASRGESCLDDCLQLGYFELTLEPKQRKKFYIVAVGCKSSEEAKNVLASLKVESLLEEELNRRKKLLAKFQEQHGRVVLDDWLKWLVLASDQFLAKRFSSQTKTVIAGYHWFEDWGRDALISLPGLALVTEKFDVAREVLQTFKHYCYRGIVPNKFPDTAGDKPVYNTVDASLWYFNAVLQYLKYTNDFAFVEKNLWDTLQSIIEHYVHGTLHDIRMDTDGLITHGEQLTWMDATIDNQSVTPRKGKAVEIQALWYNALKTMKLLANHLSQTEKASEYERLAEKAKKSFLEKFWNQQKGYLFDVVGEYGKDDSLRPNQIIAVALDFSMLDAAKGEAIIKTLKEKLLCPYGLRTLAKDDPKYVGRYEGNWNERNKAYHNGTAWAWLLGPFTTAFLKLKNYEENWRNYAFQNFLRPLFMEQIFQGGMGSLNEIYDGDPPHAPRGCIAQAWSVAEPLRAYIEDVMLERPPFERQILNKGNRVL